MSVEKTCIICEKSFKVNSFRAETAKTCSWECRNKWFSIRGERKRSKGKCAGCGGIINAPARARRKFCSPECKAKTKRKALVCPSCGKEFWDWASRIKRNRQFCSKVCADKAKIKPKEPAKKRRKGERIAKICETCKQAFTVNAFRAETARFCSTECKANSGAWKSECSEREKARHAGKPKPKRQRWVYRAIMTEWMTEEVPDHLFLAMDETGTTVLHSRIMVHHIDEDWNNNARENLLAVTPEAHSRIHTEGKRPDPWECWPPNPERY